MVMCALPFARKYVYSVGMSQLLPPKTKKTRTTVGLTDELWAELAEVVEATGYNRDDVMEEFLRVGLAQWRLQRGKDRKER